MSTSPTSGTLRIGLGPSPSIAATMCLDTAFFDPRTRISPRSGPDGSTCQVPAMQHTVRANPPTPRGPAESDRQGVLPPPDLGPVPRCGLWDGSPGFRAYGGGRG